MNRSSSRWLAVGVAVAVIGAVLVFVLLEQDGEQSAGASPRPSVAATPEVSPTATLDQELLSQRFNVLVIGLDSNQARRDAGQGVNTDTLIVASISADQSEVTLVSVPRDMVDIPAPLDAVWEGKVNAIYADQGVDTLVASIGALLDVPLRHYALIDMDDLAALVDAAGGVTVDPDEPLADPKVDLDLQAGEQELDGATALSYVRTRVDTDYGRAARQQEVLLDLVRRLVSPETDVDVAELLSGLGSFETSLPLDGLPTLMEIGRRAQEASVTRQVLQPPEFITFEGDAGDGRGYILVPDVEAIRAFAAETIGQD